MDGPRNVVSRDSFIDSFYSQGIDLDLDEENQTP